MKFLSYEASRTVPNIVVDGSPNESTVLTLTHWPTIPQPAGMAADLSAEMAFRYLDAPVEHAPAAVVTNNHFDQDGLVGVHALVAPDTALPHRELLIDLAAAGDFGTYRDRRAARASMTISRFAERPHEDYATFAARCYEEVLPLVLPMLLDGDRFREHWADEDQALTVSEQAVASGAVTFAERIDTDLAVFTLPPAWVDRGGHRFGGEHYGWLHPMAVNSATACVRLLLVNGRRYRYTDRYETWVQFVTRTPPRRVDLRPLAGELTALETGSARWSADEPGALTPTLEHSDESSLDPPAVVATIERHLRTAVPAWDPYAKGAQRPAP